jgi:hypothetical protein
MRILLTSFVITLRRQDHRRCPGHLAHLFFPRARTQTGMENQRNSWEVGLRREVFPDCISSIASEDSSHSQYLGRVFVVVCTLYCRSVLRFLYHISLQKKVVPLRRVLGSRNVGRDCNRKPCNSLQRKCLLNAEGGNLNVALCGALEQHVPHSER